MNLGDIIKNKRELLNFTQREISEYLNVHVQQVSNFERNICPIPDKHLLKLIVKLDLEEDTILTLALNEKRAKLLEEINKYRV